MSANTETNFVRRVREELTAQRLSIRALAKRIDPHNVERARRNLHRWLDEGIAPSVVGRAEVADALGIPVAELDGDEDDEEEDDAVAALMSALRRVVRDELRAA